MKRYSLTMVTAISAEGGPEEKISRDKTGDGNEATPTTPGRYVMKTFGSRISKKNPKGSAVLWGTPMKRVGDVTMVKVGENFKRLSSVNDTWQNLARKLGEKGITEGLIATATVKLMLKTAFPDKWIFNDFGHVAIGYYKDSNHNGKMDGKEHLMGDYIHPTPIDEALVKNNGDYTLERSHGCIHVGPLEIDKLIKSGFLRKGLVFEVHPYKHRNVIMTFETDIAKPPYEAHFYPGLNTLMIYKVTRNKFSHNRADHHTVTHVLPSWR